jgi:hypothetical protein
LILVPVDLADTDLAKPAISRQSRWRATPADLCGWWCPAMTPVMLAEYVPPDFDVQQRKSAEALSIMRECGLDAAHVSATVRQGGIYHGCLRRALQRQSDCDELAPSAMRTYFLGSTPSVVRYAKCSVLVVRN